MKITPEIRNMTQKNWREITKIFNSYGIFKVRSLHAFLAAGAPLNVQKNYS